MELSGRHQANNTPRTKEGEIRLTRLDTRRGRCGHRCQVHGSSSVLRPEATERARRTFFHFPAFPSCEGSSVGETSGICPVRAAPFPGGCKRGKQFLTGVGVGKNGPPGTGPSDHLLSSCLLLDTSTLPSKARSQAWLPWDCVGKVHLHSELQA